MPRPAKDAADRLPRRRSRCDQAEAISGLRGGRLRRDCAGRPAGDGPLTPSCAGARGPGVFYRGPGAPTPISPCGKFGRAVRAVSPEGRLHWSFATRRSPKDAINIPRPPQVFAPRPGHRLVPGCRFCGARATDPGELVRGAPPPACAVGALRWPRMASPALNGASAGSMILRALRAPARSAALSAVFLRRSRSGCGVSLIFDRSLRRVAGWGTRPPTTRGEV